MVLGVSGGIAAYKAVEVCRRLVDDGYRVVPVLTAAAERFVGAVTFSALATEPVRRSLFDDASPIPHTELGRRAEVVVVAPATADLLARYAAGLADDLLTATLLATAAPVVVAPAMHTEMWEHPAVRHNLEVLAGRGVTVVPPTSGRLAGGDLGPGRLAEPETIVAAVRRVLRSPRGDLAGRTVVVSAGGTREPLDAVRYLTNRSSGKQGHALAATAARRGASVDLVTTASLALPADVVPSVRRHQVETAAEMDQALSAVAAAADVVVMAAAVADFRPKAPPEGKLAREDGVPEVVLEPTPDILAGLVERRRPGQVLVGFAAEVGPEAIERGRAKLERKGVDVLVVNDVSAPGAGFDHDTNAVVVLERDGSSLEVPLASKEAVADTVFDTVVRLLGPEASRAS